MVNKCLECSTLHLPEYVMLRLEDSVDASDTGLDALYGIPVYEMPGKGFILPVPESPKVLDDIVRLEPLANLFVKARELGCSWLVLDAVSEILPDMPVSEKNTGYNEE